jgi:hypothetical protein
MRYGLGWGLGGVLPAVAVLNFIYLLVTGIVTIRKMTATNEIVDGSSGTSFKADTFFGFGELFCATCEIIASVVFVVTVDSSAYAIMAVLANLTGWVSVYAVGIWAMIARKEYNPSLMQRIFHYCMIVMLWAINEVGSR